MGIPALRKNGLLPRGLHRATFAELRQAFGESSPRRAMLAGLLEEAIERAWKLDVERILVDGSFVTARKNSGDVDLVFHVSDRFFRRLERGESDALWIGVLESEISPRLLDLYCVYDEGDWTSWGRSFEENQGRGRKGIVEVIR